MNSWHSFQSLVPDVVKCTHALTWKSSGQNQESTPNSMNSLALSPSLQAHYRQPLFQSLCLRYCCCYLFKTAQIVSKMTFTLSLWHNLWMEVIKMHIVKQTSGARLCFWSKRSVLLLLLLMLLLPLHEGASDPGAYRDFTRPLGVVRPWH